MNKCFTLEEAVLALRCFLYVIFCFILFFFFFFFFSFFFSKKDDEKLWTSEWDRKIIFSNGTEHARGVCVIVNPNSLFQEESVEIDPEGRFIVAKLDEDYSIVTQLKVSDGEIISGIKQINKQIEDYYKSFLTSKVPQDDHEHLNELFNSFVEDLENPKLTEDEQE